MKKLALLLLLIGFSILPVWGQSSNVYVSGKGSNGNSGTLSAPYRTIQHAIDNAVPGQTIYVRGGTYHEKLVFSKSGSSLGGYITLASYPGESAVLDGTDVPGNDMIRIENQHYIIVDGMEIRGNVTKEPHGIAIGEGSEHILIKNNAIHGISTTGSGANAIVVKSVSAKGIRHISIDSNHIYDCEVGHSEALTISGNVWNFYVINNTVNGINNIGIDIAGHYDGPYQASTGVVSNNTVYNCHSSYGTYDASGIYVDGGKGIKIDSNKVFHNDYGITVGCENPGKTASEILIVNNRVYDNDKSGISLGGYKKAVGRVDHVIVANNHVMNNNALGLSYHSELNLKLGTGFTIKDNVFTSRQSAPVNFDTDTVYYPMIYNLDPIPKLILSNNKYYCPAGAAYSYFRINDIPYMGFERYRVANRLDLDSVFSDPDSVVAKASYVIDGKDGDWKYVAFISDASPMKLDCDAVNFYLLAKSTASNGRNAFYIDSDNTIDTGLKTFLWKNIGADYLIENGNLYRYTGDGGSWSFDFVAKIDAAVDATIYEVAVPLSHLQLKKNDTIKIAFSSTGAHSYYIPQRSGNPISFTFK